MQHTHLMTIGLLIAPLRKEISKYSIRKWECKIYDSNSCQLLCSNGRDKTKNETFIQKSHSPPYLLISVTTARTYADDHHQNETHSSCPHLFFTTWCYYSPYASLLTILSQNNKNLQKHHKFHCVHYVRGFQHTVWCLHCNMQNLCRDSAGWRAPEIKWSCSSVCEWGF